MSNRLYVGNLPFDTTKETLEGAFSAIGQVSEVHIPIDRDSGRMRGFAFVTMASASAAANAIERMNGAMLDGRALRVNEAHERQREGGGRR